MDIITEIEQVFERMGNLPFLGECVTQLEHALQCARAAERERASGALIAAALLHDIGHLVHDIPPEDANYVGYWNRDDRHEEVGANWLARAFRDEVVEPVRWHVAAKRYLCAVDPEHLKLMTAATLHQLALQGGPMTAEECREFEKNPWKESALALRRWGNQAKTSGRVTPPLSHYLEIARASLKGP